MRTTYQIVSTKENNDEWFSIRRIETDRKGKELSNTLFNKKYCRKRDALIILDSIMRGKFEWFRRHSNSINNNKLNSINMYKLIGYIVILICLIPLLYWAYYPYLTLMQIGIKFWYIMPLELLLLHSTIKLIRWEDTYTDL